MPLGAFKAGMFGAAGGGSGDSVAMEKIADTTTAINGQSSFSFTSIPQTYDDLIVTFGAAESFTSPYQSGFYVWEVQPYFNNDYNDSIVYSGSVINGDPNLAGSIFSGSFDTTGDMDNFGYISANGNGNSLTCYKLEFQVSNYTRTDVYKNYYWRSFNGTDGSSWVGGREGFGSCQPTSDITRSITSISFRGSGNPNWFDGYTKCTLWGVKRAGV